MRAEPTAAEWLEHCAREMTRAGVFFGHGTDNAHDEAACLVLSVLEAPRDGSFQSWGQTLDKNQQAQVRDLLGRRIKERRPLAYLTGNARFCGLDFIVTDDVLIPRSPIAELIRQQFSPWLEAPVQQQQTGRVLDMCTGGGCIAIAIAVYLPAVQVDAVDISSAALGVAARNVARHGLGERVRLLQSDLFSAINAARYDLIVSNPPYVAADMLASLPPEYHAEPSGGLVSGQDGLDLVLEILAGAPSKLTAHGILVVEVGESAGALAALLPMVPFLWLEFSHGGEGVFLLEYEQLIACQADVRAVLEQRGYV